MHERSTRQRFGRRLANLLLIAGGLTLAFPFWSAAYTELPAEPPRHRLRPRERRLSPSTAEQAPILGTPAIKARRLAAQFARGLKPGDPVGRLDHPADQDEPGRPAGHKWLRQSGPSATRASCAAGLCTTGSRRCPGPANPSPSPATGPPTARPSSTSTTCTPATDRRGHSLRAPHLFSSQEDVVLPNDVRVLAITGTPWSSRPVIRRTARRGARRLGDLKAFTRAEQAGSAVAAIAGFAGAESGRERRPLVPGLQAAGR